MPDTTVKINVSLKEDTKEFLIHKSFLCFYSPYFKAALNDSFKEGESQSVVLEDMCPVAFAIFANWLYFQRIECANDDELTHENCLELWLLAERLIIPRLQNEAMTALHNFPSILMERECFVRLCENTLEGSPLRKYLVFRYTAKTDDKINYGVFPPDMLTDMLNLAGPQLPSVYQCTGEEVKAYHVEEQLVRFTLYS